MGEWSRKPQTSSTLWKLITLQGRRVIFLQYEHVAANALAIFLMLMLMCLMRRSPIYGLDANEVITFPWGLQFVDREWLPNDWFLNTSLGSQLLIGSLIGLLVKVLGFVTASIVGRLLIYSFLSISLSLLTYRLRIPIAYTLAALFVFISARQNIGAGEWIFGGIESKVAAYGFVFLALYYVLDRRYILGAALFGVATSFHILVGPYGFIAYAIYCLLEKIKLKGIIKFLPYYCLGAVIGIYNAVDEIVSAWDAPDVSRLIVYFRVPHHTVPSYFSWNWEYRLAILIGAFIVLYWFIQVPKAPKSLLKYAAAAMVPYVIGLAVAPFDENGSFLKYYPFRLGDTLFPLFVAFVGYFGIKCLVSDRALRIVLPVLGAGALTLAAGNFVGDIKSFRSGDASRDVWAQACSWIKQHTPEGAVVVVPPGNDSFTAVAQRATVATFRQFPFARVYIPEWYDRLIDLSGGIRPIQRGYRATTNLDNNYFRLSESQMLEILRKYGASYIVTTCRDTRELVVAYSNEKFCVYRPRVKT